MGVSGSSSERLCPNCGIEVEIIETVPWQDDLCTECGKPVSQEE